MLIADAEDDFVAPFVQTAAAAIANVLEDLRQGVAGRRQGWQDDRGCSAAVGAPGRSTGPASAVSASRLAPRLALR
jgi:hypothetical protein